MISLKEVISITLFFTIITILYLENLSSSGVIRGMRTRGMKGYTTYQKMAILLPGLIGEKSLRSSIQKVYFYTSALSIAKPL